ncbi:TetR/AcrR family transcriptional regulator [Paraburkholderia acidiphila]|uniref:TetR family transcriptional regulator n=1 Tax=Paraburkholderia acidiphila TaxID=2571747 RepID=A0A7Z2G965_9BURK|nr:TetR/AcrR family transcriptional regulator [Paraburkholderia acidiphila]QGZ57510.1 TetR family transcriptional regulator [Paraburkholderia acidiphila]
MARPLSPEKRNALLVAATHAVAEQGVLASTASIARRAGVAEGTLFTYFENKDVLFQELYLHLKDELAETIMPDYPSEADFRLRLEHVFQHYVRWGVANTAGRLAIARLSASGQLWDETRTKGMEPFLAVSQMMEEAVQSGVLLDAPIAFLYSIIERIADTTIEFVERQPDNAERHRQLGFHAAWRAITP